MKKNEYVSPDMEIVEIEMQGLIASSIGEGEVDGELTPGGKVPDDDH